MEFQKVSSKVALWTAHRDLFNSRPFAIPLNCLLYQLARLPSIQWTYQYSYRFLKCDIRDRKNAACFSIRTGTFQSGISWVGVVRWVLQTYPHEKALWLTPTGTETQDRRQGTHLASVLTEWHHQSVTFPPDQRNCRTRYDLSITMLSEGKLLHVCLLCRSHCYQTALVL